MQNGVKGKKIGVTIGILASLLLFVGSGFAYYSHIQKEQELKVQQELIEKNKQIVIDAQNAVKGLYYDGKKEALVSDISTEKIELAKSEVELVNDDSRKQELMKEINDVTFLLETRMMVGSLLKDGILVDNADETIVSSMNDTVADARKINEKIVVSFEQDIDAINLQMSEIAAARGKVSALFMEANTQTVREDITRKQLESVEAKVEVIKNFKVKEGLNSLIKEAEIFLTKKEEENQAKLAAEQKKKDEEEKRKQEEQTRSSNQSKTAAAVDKKPVKKPVEKQQSQTGLAGIVAKSSTAQKTDQIVTVVAKGSSAQISLLEKNGDTWKEVIKTNGYVGVRGVGQAREGSKRTPKGSYSLGFAFGTSNPGTKLPFRKITPNSYWISNVNDPQYNTWQERTSSDKADEHLIDYKVQYQYAIVINYNNGVGGGSAFFLHVANGGPTAGCVSVSKNVMVQFMQRIHSGAYIINVNSQSEIANY